MGDGKDIMTELSKELAEVEDLASEKARATLENPQLQQTLAKFREQHGCEPFAVEERDEDLPASEPSEREEYASFTPKPAHQKTIEMERVRINAAAVGRRGPRTSPSLLKRAARTVGQTERLHPGSVPEPSDLPPVAHEIAEQLTSSEAKTIGGRTRRIPVGPRVDPAVWDGDAPEASSPDRDTTTVVSTRAQGVPSRRKVALVVTTTFVTIAAVALIAVGRRGSAGSSPLAPTATSLGSSAEAASLSAAPTATQQPTTVIAPPLSASPATEPVQPSGSAKAPAPPSRGSKPKVAAPGVPSSPSPPAPPAPATAHEDPKWIQ